MLAKIHPHPRDNHVSFDEASHTYFVDDVKVGTSVTTFIHHFFEPFDAVAIATKCVYSAKPGTEYYGKSTEEIVAKWSEGATKGTKMREAIEEYFNMSLEEKTDLMNTDKYGLFAQV